MTTTMMMKRSSRLAPLSWLAAALIGSLSLTLALPTVAADYLTEEGRLFLRPRVGHFSRYETREPLSSAYKLYFDNVIKNNDKAMRDLDSNDWRRVRPTAELCIDFLMDLQVKEYLLDKPHEVIIMDACLDWMLGNPQHTDKQLDLDSLSRGRRETLKYLEGDEKLKSIYEKTAFKDKTQMPRELAAEIYNYVKILLQVHGANPFKGCHGHWLEAYNNFLDNVYLRDCEDETNCRFYGLDKAADDSYLAMIAQSTVEASKQCYHVMQTQIRGLMEAEYAQSTSPVTLAKRLRRTPVSRQLEKEKWTHEMGLVLQIAEGVSPTSTINLGDAAVQLEKIKEGDERTTERFLEAVGRYADENTDETASANDYNGRGRYGRAMGKLCRPFIDYVSFMQTIAGIDLDQEQNTRKPFDFYNIVYSLVRLTNHERIIGITKAEFEQHVISNQWEAVYLSTLACQVIYTTWGTLNTVANVQRYKVRLVPHSRLMIGEWPVEVMSERLPLLSPKSSATTTSKLRPSAVRGLFGVSKHQAPQPEVETPVEQQDESEQPPQIPIPRQNRTPSWRRMHGTGINSAPAAAASIKPTRNGEIDETINPKALSKEPYEGMPLLKRSTIEMYFKRNGRLPRDLTDIYFELYPSLLSEPYTTPEQQAYYFKFNTMGDMLQRSG